jgi:hypothetical protein
MTNPHNSLLVLLFCAGTLVHAGQPDSAAGKIGHGAAELGRGLKDGTVGVFRSIGAGTRKTAGAFKAVGGGTAVAAERTADSTAEGARRVGRGSKAIGRGVKDGAVLTGEGIRDGAREVAKGKS